MKHAPVGLAIDNKPLITSGKRVTQKFLVLLSNSIVVIDTEMQSMKKALKFGKPISDMHMTDARIHSQTTTLNKLLETLETENQNFK